MTVSSWLKKKHYPDIKNNENITICSNMNHPRQYYASVQLLSHV